MRNFLKFGLLSALALASAACTRVETGEVGVRRTMSKQIEKEELPAGSLNQTMFGDVLIFPVKDNSVEINDMTPLAGDNSTIKDFDIQVIYSLNANSVSELYTGKSQSFHATNDNGQIFLMYNYINQLGRNAAYKAARGYESLKLADNRAQLEATIKAEIINQLRNEKLADDVNISQVIVKQITPAASIVASANELVQAQNAEKQKAVEVRTAKLEAERIAALNANSGATKYMEATAIVTIAEAIKGGKVSTIVVPYDFKGIVNVK